METKFDNYDWYDLAIIIFLLIALFIYKFYGN